MRHLATLGVPPPRDRHDRVQSGRFLRGLLLRVLVILLPFWALIALAALVTDLPSWILLLGGVSLALLAADVLWLTYRVRRDERRAARQ
jgi:membrane protein implicated in regulation of membrane protease activity